MPNDPQAGRSYKRLARFVTTLGALSVAVLSWSCIAPSLAAAALPEEPITETCAGPIVSGGWEMCGTLNPHVSAKVGYYFAYDKGPSCTGPGSFAAAGGEEREGEAVKVSGRMSALEGGTEYTYCLVATNSSGETFGQPISMTTPPATAKPLTEAPAAVTSTSATLEGTLEPAGTRLQYEFETNRGTSCEGGSTTPTTTGEGKVSAVVEGLTPNTVYAFCLTAYSTQGGIAVGAPMTFTTLESQAENESKRRQQQIEAEAIAAARKAQEESAAVAAAKLQEELNAAAAESKLQYEAAIAAQEKIAAGAAASIKIIKVAVSSTTVTVTLGTSQVGSVTISGSGLRATTKIVTAGTSRIKVALTRAGKRDRLHHQRVKLAVQLAIGDKVVVGSRTVKL
jgi:hypothetical protein